MDAALYHGVVTHRRFKPVEHRLAYRVFSLLVDLDRLDALDGGLRLFSRNRFNLFSLFDRDHGDGSSDLAAHVRALLRERGFADRGAFCCYATREFSATSSTRFRSFTVTMRITASKRSA